MKRMLCLSLAIHVLAQAEPPVLQIASEPLRTACRSAVPATLNGPSLLRLATGPDSNSVGELFQATLSTTDWAGHFTRHTLLTSGASRQIASSATWDAGAILTGDLNRPPAPAPRERQIFTAIIQADGSLNMIPFDWPSLSETQQRQLGQALPGRSIADLGQLRLAFLRGDRALEGTLFRQRGSVLGDAVNSTPHYIGRAAAAAAASSPRPEVIYLGANDGMLHAFNAADGRELFAYVPAALFPALSQLSDTDYQHRAYVDGPAGSGEAVIAGIARTILVAGMGGGAQGVFALDVSDPVHFASNGGALWEFTDADDALMGNVSTPPQIAKLRMDTRAGRSAERYFAVVASGLNNYAGDAHAEPSGQGALFLLALDKPRSEPWQLDANYYRLITPLSDATLANGLQAPVLVAGRDGTLRYGYAGDLQGNLWRFDFRGGPPWANAVGPGANRKPLFVARDAAGKRQAITQQPLLAYDHEGYLILFGTGKLIETADRGPASFAPQSYYAIRDRLREPAVLVTERSQLTERVLRGTADVALLQLSGQTMEADSKGWYIDFLQAAQTGERSVDSGVLSGGQLVFNTLLPASDPCGAARSRSYALNVLTGLPEDGAVARLPDSPADGQPLVGALSMDYAAAPALVPVASRRGQRDPGGGVRSVKEFSVANVGSHGGVPLGVIQTVSRDGRLSWREVVNWRQLHEAAR